MVTGVVTGPTVISCIERGDFNQCISEAYFGAQPVIAEAEPVAVNEPVAAAETDPEPEVAQEQPIAVPAIPPAFAVVRVEPDGSAVIAGTGAPSSEIQIFANGDLLGSETTEASGDFAHVTATPLPTGGVELRLLDVASGEYATTSIVVIVAEDRTSEPLVVASEPGQASEILQGLESAPAADTEAPMAVAAAPQEAVVQEPAAQTVEPEPVVAEAPAQEAPVEEAPVEAPVAIAEADEPAIEAPAVDEPVAAPAEPAPVVAEEPAQSVAEEPATVVAEETGPLVAEQSGPVVAEEPAAEAIQPQVASVPAPVEDEAPAPVVVAIVPPTIEAVEIDGDRNFFAGGGTDGFAVRLYVENDPVGTTEVSDGRWLVEAINVLTAVSQRIRVDMIAEDGTVAGRTEVDFVIDLPEPPAEPVEAPVVVANAPQPAPTPDAQTAPEPEAEQEPEPQPAAEPEPVAIEEPVVETAPQQTVPTLVGTTTGDRTTSGQVIIRRGDNLWTIARRVYGEGLRYTQIYEANANSIRNPDLIYPGQVFGLPGTDMMIGNEP